MGDAFTAGPIGPNVRCFSGWHRRLLSSRRVFPRAVDLENGTEEVKSSVRVRRREPGRHSCQALDGQQTVLCQYQLWSLRAGTLKFDGPPRGRPENLDGEFDPGSGRTLAACFTHASRTGLIRW